MRKEHAAPQPEAGDRPPLSARRAFLQADFFAYMLDYQATAARMRKEIDAAQLAAGKALRETRQTSPVEDYIERLKRDRRRLCLARALSDEELEEIRNDLRNMPGVVSQYLAENPAGETGSPGNITAEFPGVTPRISPQ